jgi:uncharacterized protein DUF6992
MWSDTLLAAERGHLIRVAVWAIASAVVGTGIVSAIAVRRLSAPIVFWFAVQTMVMGTLELIITAGRWLDLSMRDLSAATELDRFTWLAVGIDAGIIGAGVAIAAMAWTRDRRLGAFGGSLGAVVQGLGLLVLDLKFTTILARLV